MSITALDRIQALDYVSVGGVDAAASTTELAPTGVSIYDAAGIISTLAAANLELRSLKNGLTSRSEMQATTLTFQSDSADPLHANAVYAATGLGMYGGGSNALVQPALVRLVTGADNIGLSLDGLVSTAKLDISGAGISFGGLEGTAGQYLASAGPGVCAIWEPLPSAYVNPLMCYVYAFPAASSGSPVWADIGEARTFAAAPAVMLQAIDATGLIIPLTLTAASTLGFDWVSSSALVGMVVSVYALA